MIGRTEYTLVEKISSEEGEKEAEYNFWTLFLRFPKVQREHFPKGMYFLKGGLDLR